MNIHDIAREAGVSIATVSRVLNDSPSVVEGTRRRVQDVIDARAYTPNALARGLLNNRTRTVGVLAVDILNPYYATVVHGIERELGSRGNGILLCNTGGSREEKRRYVRTLLEKRVDGLVFVGSVYREDDGKDEILAAARSVPVVMINSIIEAENVYCLLCDDRAGIREAASFLLDRGRGRILFVSTRATASARLKEEAFLDLLAERGAGRGAERGAGEGLVLETAVERIAELPGAIAAAWAKRPFDAVLATDDLFANVAVNTLHSQRIDVPGQVWVLGYNDSYVSEQTFPRLSSVDSRMADIAASCASLISRVLAGEAGIEPVSYLRPRLVIKDSTGQL